MQQLDFSILTAGDRLERELTELIRMEYSYDRDALIFRLNRARKQHKASRHISEPLRLITALELAA